MPVERAGTCHGCCQAMATPMNRALTPWHGECWLKELRRRWIEAPTPEQRAAIKEIADEVKKHQQPEKGKL